MLSNLKDDLLSIESMTYLPAWLEACSDIASKLHSFHTCTHSSGTTWSNCPYKPRSSIRQNITFPSHIKHISPSLPPSVYLLRPTPRRIPRPIHRPLHMSRNPILARIKLAPNHALFTQRTANLLSNLPDGAVGVELLADCAGGGEDGGVLFGWWVG